MVKDVVLIRGDAEGADGKAHLLGEPSGEDVAEVPGGYDELGVGAVFLRQLHPGPDVVDALGEDAGDVDGIDGGEVLRLGEGDIAKDVLHDALGVIEGAGRADGEDVVRASTAIGVEDENGDAVLAHAAVNGGAAGIPRGGSEDGEALAGESGLALVKEAKELEGEVLEGQRGAVEKLEDKGLVIELAEWGDVWRVEAGVGLGGEAVPLGGGDLRAEDLEELRGEFGIGELGPGIEVAGEVGKGIGQEETGVGSEPGFDGLGEGLWFGLASGGKVLHG